ncbi:MarR family winged helix-turn-helix transcriptional regulator [Streptomyces spiramyceticus]|uniref:MarR family winged helix-turn-helix transcriptional regulator n=1 Tax=Streptomyces spiramyceticus TaxID=299717 RepID=UPI00237A532F|nr:MarR family transcriptional regulator [Streptomyces spiramyceticus]
MERLAESFSGYYGDFSLAAADAGLTASQAKTLGVLRASPASMRSLATTLACDASNITGIVDRLEKRELVRREVSPTDRRVKNVALTEAGEETVDAIRARMHTTHAAIDALGDEERATLYELLGRVFSGSRGLRGSGGSGPAA